MPINLIQGSGFLNGSFLPRLFGVVIRSPAFIAAFIFDFESWLWAFNLGCERDFSKMIILEELLV